MTFRLVIACALLAFASATNAREGEVRPERVRADMEFLAGDELRGRGSGTPDEAAAAAYVADQFLAAGLQTAPGMTGYLQEATIVVPRLAGPASLTVDGAPLVSLSLLRAAEGLSGELAIFDDSDPAKMPAAKVVLASDSGAASQRFIAAARQKGVALLIVPESAETREAYSRSRSQPRLGTWIEDMPREPGFALATLSDDQIVSLKAKAGANVVLDLPLAEPGRMVTTNAIGFLPGVDPEAGLILLTAHLDHLGVRGDMVMYGANDDASGTTAVIELARVLGAGDPLQRGVLFVAYGGEEMGLIGSRFFAGHPPVPLDKIAVNLEFEMIGMQDPQLPPGTMMMTGFERSEFGEQMKAMGALVTADPYPEQNFFRRSDNYSLALRGIVAHTVSGWATTPTYHTADDTLAEIDFGFMSRAIASLIDPLRAIGNSQTAPQWLPGGRP